MSTSDRAVLEGIAALAQFFVADGTMTDTLLRVTELARDVLSADLAGITLVVEGRLTTGVFTDPLAVDVDRKQYETDGEGPCVDSYRQQIVFHIADTATDRRWPEFAATAAAVGIVTTLSLPLSRTGTPLGALNLYARTPGALDGSVTGIEAAEALAAQAGIVLANTRAYHDARELSENLQQALKSRAVIEHAIGVLVGAGGGTPDECFEVLRRASQRENRKVRDIAIEMVTTAVNRNPRRTDAPR